MLVGVDSTGGQDGWLCGTIQEDPFIPPSAVLGLGQERYG